MTHASSALAHRPWEEVSPELGELLRADLSAVADEVIEEIRRQIPAYSRPLEGEFGSALRAGVEDGMQSFLGLLGSDAEPPERIKRLYREFGRWEVSEGRTLEGLLAAYRLAARIAWRRISETIDGRGLGEAAVARLAEALFAYIDEISAASVEGFAAEQASRAGDVERRRARLVALLARRPPAEPATIRSAAADAGWTLPRTLAALAWRSGERDRVVAHLPNDSIAAAHEDVTLAFIPDPDGPGRRREIERAVGSSLGCLGTTEAWPEAHRSAARARGVQELVDIGVTAGVGLVAAEAHLAELITLGDPSLLEDLAARRLAGLGELGEATRERLERTLLAWLDAQGNMREAAAALDVHPQTVRYRTTQLRELLGEALDDPRARYELLLVLRSRHVL